MSAKSSKTTPTRTTATSKSASPRKSPAASKTPATSTTVPAGKVARARVAAVSKSAPVPATRNNPSKLFTANSKSQSGPLTSEAIATDLAAFKKAGGRIEVLGNTPTRTTSTAFRSAGNTARTAAAPAAAATAGATSKTRS